MGLNLIQSCHMHDLVKVRRNNLLFPEGRILFIIHQETSACFTVLACFYLYLNVLK